MRTLIIREGETIQAVSERAYNDATRWHELVELNHLSYPYISKLPSGGTLQVGDPIQVLGDPLPEGTGSRAISERAKKVLGTDIKTEITQATLTNDSSIRLTSYNGDLALQSGYDNVQQALLNRLNTPKSSLPLHRNYGNEYLDLIGVRNSYSNFAKLQTFVALTAQQDSRVEKATVTLPYFREGVVVIDLSIKIRGLQDLEEMTLRMAESGFTL